MHYLMKTTARLKNLHRPEHRVDAELTAAGDTMDLHEPGIQAVYGKSDHVTATSVSYKTQNLQIKLIVFSMIKG